MPQTIAERLAQFCYDLCYDDIPPAVIDKTKRLILDTIGVCLGSTRIDFGEAALGLASRWGGAPEASLIGGRAKVPVQNAAFCNGVLGHGQDYDDTHTESVVHPSAALVPVALAAAERAGSSGRETLAALIAGLETTIRIGMPALNKFHLRGFHTTSIAATFGAALIAAKLDRIGLERTIDAVGVSGSFTSGLLECIPAAAGAKRLHAGWAALCGVMAAQLAEAGYTGPSTVFEGKLGVYESFLPGEALDLEQIFKGLGGEWETLNTRPKLYPCCHYLQAFLDCAAVLRREHRLQPEAIEKIACRVAPGAVNIVCEPWEKKLRPLTGYDARFSLPFAVSLMLARGKAGVAEFSERSLGDPVIRQLMPRVRYQPEAKYEVKHMPGWVEVTLRSGARHVFEVPEVRGNARNPVPLEELLDKFHANTAFLGRSAASRIADQILECEKLTDVRGLMSLLTRAGHAWVSNAPVTDVLPATSQRFMPDSPAMNAPRIEALVAGILQGERRTIARAISEVENETAAGYAIMRSIYPHLGRADVIGVTGSPGAGKSTLVSGLIGEFRARGRSVGVVAVDPSSPFSGGAVLGDRIRMERHALAERVFIRSLASRGHAGGLSRAVFRVVDVLDAAGFDVIIVETVGAGQSEVEIADIADVRVVVCAPGLGDDVQAIKAGILEIADILVVSKCDLPLADKTELDLRFMVSARAQGAAVPRVLRVAALSGEGIPELADAIESHANLAGRRRETAPLDRMRRLIAHDAANTVRSRLSAVQSATLDALCAALARGEIAHEAAIAEAVKLAACASQNERAAVSEDEDMAAAVLGVPQKEK